MKTKIAAILTLTCIPLVSCVDPNATPAQQARQAQANAQVAGAIAAGISTAVIEAAVNRGPRGFVPMAPRPPRSPFFP
jgi:hypothetical protein